MNTETGWLKEYANSVSQQGHYVLMSIFGSKIKAVRALEHKVIEQIISQAVISYHEGAH